MPMLSRRQTPASSAALRAPLCNFNDRVLRAALMRPGQSSLFKPT
jgi:hypothetical protein